MKLRFPETFIEIHLPAELRSPETLFKFQISEVRILETVIQFQILEARFPETFSQFTLLKVDFLETFIDLHFPELRFLETFIKLQIPEIYFLETFIKLVVPDARFPETVSILMSGNHCFYLSQHSHSVGGSDFKLRETKRTKIIFYYAGVWGWLCKSLLVCIAIAWGTPFSRQGSSLATIYFFPGGGVCRTP